MINSIDRDGMMKDTIRIDNFCKIKHTTIACGGAVNFGHLVICIKIQI